MVEFINAFLSYGLLVVIFAAIMIVGGFIGVKLRGAKDKKNAALATETVEESANEKAV